jgi:hypothetical protein
MSAERKTPRTKAQWRYYVYNDMHDAGEEFAERLEIETQELAEALAYLVSFVEKFETLNHDYCHAALDRHRANQPTP